VTQRWLAGDVPAGSQVRLFCFPHAGGGGSFFLPWTAELAPQVAVCPVVLPGREGRIREPAFDRLAPLLDALVEALLPYTDQDFAIFGHSMGSVVGYEFARRLEREHGRRPRCLLVSGRRAPHLPARRAPLHALPDQGFTEALRGLNGTPSEVLEDEGLLRLFRPTLRADFAVNETYTASAGAPLTCPVSALTGTADPEVTVEEMAQWQSVTAGAFRLRVFYGDHFYLKSRPEDVLDAIRQDLTEPASSPYQEPGRREQGDDNDGYHRHDQARSSAGRQLVLRGAADLDRA
jgi:medium-chain acyl-[acyl-carrier-protein] hydrolase